MHISEIRPWLHITDREACLASSVGPKDLTVHIWRDDYREKQVCPVGQAILDDPQQTKSPCGDAVAASLAGTRHIAFQYKDCEEFEPGFLDFLASEVRSSGPSILVHCTQGACRSPTVGLFVLSLRERRHPSVLIGDFFSAIYRCCGFLPNLGLAPLRQIVAWYEDNVGALE